MYAVVVPTIREECIGRFVSEWGRSFRRQDLRLIVIEDHPARQFELPDWVEHYCRADITGMLGVERSRCIPVQSGGVRAFGFWLAAQDRAIDMIATLDDDCYPLPGGWADTHWARLAERYNHYWRRTIPGAWPRGVPYDDAVRGGVQAVMNMGLWEGVPDYDAPTQLLNPRTRLSGLDLRDYQFGLVPRGMYYPMCIMNVAFRREWAPAMYMPKLPNGMKRWDDIWCGVFSKKLADILGQAVIYGMPCIRHERASNVWSNLRQEVGGIEVNERLWRVVDAFVPTPGERRVHMLYKELAQHLLNNTALLGVEFEALGVAMIEWAELWSGDGDNNAGGGKGNAVAAQGTPAEIVDVSAPGGGGDADSNAAEAIRGSVAKHS